MVPPDAIVEGVAERLVQGDIPGRYCGMADADDWTERDRTRSVGFHGLTATDIALTG